MIRAAALAAMLGGCAGHECPAGYTPATVAELHFGIGQPGAAPAVAQDDAWRAFLAEVVTPLFPDGLTVWAADGQWREAPDGPISREPARVLRIVLPRHDAAAAATSVERVVAGGKTRLGQSAVLITLLRGCEGLR